MAIQALPKTTIHLIGAAQAITTPHALIKELIDNSIDAHATSIDILISPNTLDKIEVRDNGHGIAEDDLDALGRRGHTSKLRTFEDLKSIGGVSLGFRGEALASAVQLGEVSVTTRTDGQPVASLVKLKVGGGIASQSRISHPVGTTLSVTKFMFKIPVRKRKFEVEAIKTLGKLKELLQGYALARPHIRFGLKVTKGGKGSWSFAPRPNDGIKEAVSQIIDRNLVAQCIEKSLSFIEHHGSVLEDPFALKSPEDQPQTFVSRDKFIVEAFLPKPDADPSKIGFGQWISVDSRPVAHDKGTMRKIVTMFKYYVKGTVFGNGEGIKTPFLRLNINCPESSYDPNVEPAKDDVLFGNEPLVLDSIEGLFKSLYGDRKTAPSKTVPSSDVIETAHSFNLLLAQKIPQTITNSPQTGNPRENDSISISEKQACEAVSKSSIVNPAEQIAIEDFESEVPTYDGTKRIWGFDMCKDYSQEVEGASAPKKRLGGCGPLQKSTIESAKPSNGLNPWLIAKLNVPVRSDRGEAGGHTEDTPGPGREYLPTTERSSSTMAHDFDHQAVIKEHSQPCQVFRSEDSREISSSSSQRDSQKRRATNHLKYPQSDPLRQISTVESEGNDDELLMGGDSEIFRRKTDFLSARHAPVPEDDLQMPVLKPRKSRGPNKPFVSPLRPIPTPVSVDGLRRNTLKGSHSSRQSDVPQSILQPEPNEELAWAMDYEKRKDSVIRRRREELRAKRSEPKILLIEEPPQSSPHKNRYHAAIASLEEDNSRKDIVDSAKDPFLSTIPDGDARAYLMRRQKSIQAQTSKLGGSVKLTRAKSLRLPLETVPNQEKLHNVLLKLPTSMLDLSQLATAVEKSDIYVTRGIQAAGLAMSTLETTVVATRVEKTVNRWMEAKSENEHEVLFNFGNLISNNLASPTRMS